MTPSPANACSAPVSVLLLEDDEIDFEHVRREFAKRKITCPLHRAISGVDALAMLRGGADAPLLPPPYILLVDINMPRMNGLEFLREIRRDPRLRAAVAFVLTTSASETDIAEAYALNAAGYFMKENVDALMSMLSLYGTINRFS